MLLYMYNNLSKLKLIPKSIAEIIRFFNHVEIRKKKVESITNKETKTEDMSRIMRKTREIIGIE